eukprot:jgi/Galph1/1211/GphlegSOOS_G6042.1
MAAILKASGAKVFPWKNWKEWYETLDALYGNREQMQVALHRIEIWRRRSTLPVAVESSAELVELLLKQDTLSEPIFSLALAMAIARFVNGLVDNLQDSAYALSVSSLAYQLGLPSFVAEMRHDISHNALPSREGLLFASKECLEWLKKYYFLSQLQKLSSATADSVSYLYGLQQEIQKCPEEKRKALISSVGKNISDSNVSSCWIPVLVQHVLVPVDSKWNASVDTIYANWKELLEMFQDRYPFFIVRLYWYLIQQGFTGLSSEGRQVSLIFGWLRLLIEQYWTILSKEQHKWMRQLVRVSIVQCIRKGFPKSSELVIRRWLQTCQKHCFSSNKALEDALQTTFPSTFLSRKSTDEQDLLKECFGIKEENPDGFLLISHKEQLHSLVENEKLTNIKSWTKCEYANDCPVGSVVRWYAVGDKQSGHKENDERNNNTQEEPQTLSSQLMQRICSF